MDNKIVVMGECVPKARPRMTKSGHVYTPAKTKNYEHLVRAHMQRVIKEPLTGPVGLEIIVYRKPPKSLSEKKARELKKDGCFCAVRPDLDNYAKIILDALNRVLYADDNQVCRLVVEKRYGEESKTEIRWEVL